MKNEVSSDPVVEVEMQDGSVERYVDEDVLEDIEYEVTA